MNSIALLDGGATLFLLAAMIYLLLNHKRLPDSRRLNTTLFLSLATFAFMTAFNFLEHSGITDKPDTLEDLSEIIFFFLFIFFIYSYKTYRDMNELRVREDWLNSALESLIQGVIIVDGQNRILRINQKASEMTGYSRSEALNREGDSILNFLDKESRKPLAFTPFRRFSMGRKMTRTPRGFT